MQDIDNDDIMLGMYETEVRTNQNSSGSDESLQQEVANIDGGAQVTNNM